MEQGDALMPTDIDFDWSLMESDRSFGFLVTLDVDQSGNELFLSQYSNWNGGTIEETANTSHDNAPGIHAPILGQTSSFAPSVVLPTDPFTLLSESSALSYENFANQSISNNYLAEPRAADTPVAASITPGQDDGGTATGVSSYVLPSAIWKATTEFTMADDDQSMGSSAVESHGEKLRAKKPSNKARLRCTRIGCSLTFPRPYELNRHVQNVHERSVNLTCPVYGCNRTSKPYGRIDNFIGHLRKHKGAQNILCLFQGCNIGPLSPILLAKHLISYHLHEHGEKPYIYKAMEILSPDILRGHVLFGLTAKQQEGKDACPLASLGCLFRLSVEHLDMEDHLKKSHDIVHRAKFYDAIVDYGIKGHDFEFGRASCVICQWEGYGLSSLLWHLKTHSEEEYRENAKELYDMFQPWIFKIGPSPCFKDMDKLFSTLTSEMVR